MEGHAMVGPGVMESIQLANLIVVFVILFVATRGAIRSGLEKRAQDIQQKITGSKTELERIQKELKAAQQEQGQIEQLKEKILSEVRSEGNKLAAAIVADAQRVADRILSDAREAAKDEARSAAHALKKKIVSESMGKALRVLSESQGKSEEAHEKLIERFLVGVPHGEKRGVSI